MIIKIDTKSYKYSHIFNYITEDLSLVKESFQKNILLALKAIESNDKKIENKRISLIGEHIEVELNDLYVEQLSNLHLKNFLLKGALMYYYSQVEIRLYNICERLPILTDCPKIDTFSAKKKDKLNKIAEYLLKNADLNIKKLENWQKISDFNKIRNSIAHSENISKKKISEYQSVSNNNKGKVNFHKLSNTITIELAYLDEIIKVSFDFIEQIIIEIWKEHNTTN